MTVTTIDAHYLGHEGFAATYLIREGDRAAFVETATAHAVPRMLEALRDSGGSPEQVDYVIITHVHLDHAGGAAALMKACPNATLLAHPKAAPHVIDPSALVASAEQVYGKAKLFEMYGTIEAIPQSRVRIMDDEEALVWGDRTLRFLHTRGHANHHFCVLDAASGGVFTGDSFGLVYPALQHNGLFALPSTSPTDFDAPAAKASLDRLVATGAKTAYLTHFGPVTELPAIAAQLHDQLDSYGAIVDDAYAQELDGEALEDFCSKRVNALFDALLAKHELETPQTRLILETDRTLNAQGAAFAVRKRRFKARRAAK